MRHGSLFSGIGGFDLAAEWMGWTNVFHCEWNAFGQQILKHHFPNAKSYTNIKTTDFIIHRGEIDILTGGFPCQPYSTAGKRKGKADDRHLWPEMLRAIREIQPSYVVGENVSGLTNWNGGMVFDEVQADLEAEGYEVLPFLLPACAVNAPHRRDRIWFIAYSVSAGARCKSGEVGNEAGSSSEDWGKGIRQAHRPACTSGVNSTGSNGVAANSNNTGNTTLRSGIDSNQQEKIIKGNQPQSKHSGFGVQGIIADTDAAGEWGNEWKGKGKGNIWEQFPTQSPLCGGDDGLPSELDGITFSKWRNESLKAYGNAIVPQVAFEIFKAIAS